MTPEMETRRERLIHFNKLALEAQKNKIALLETMELDCLLEFKYSPYGFTIDFATSFLVYVKYIQEETIKLRVLACAIFNLDDRDCYPFTFLVSTKKGPVITIRNYESNKSLTYADFLELKQVPLFNLPLYLDWKWKSPDFLKLLSNVPTKDPEIDRIIKKSKI